MPRGRSTVLYLELRSGTRAAVRRAYDCTSTPRDGGVSTTCQPRTGEVMFFPAGDKGALRLQAPELAQWLQDGWQQDLPTVAPPPNDTGTSPAADLQRTGLQAVLAQPSAPAAVSPDQAAAAAARVLGAPAADTVVTAEHTLLTLPGTPGMTARPVYLVTYDGVPLLPTGPGPMPASQQDGAASGARGPVRGKVTAVIDANTGEWIMGIAR